MGLVLGDLQYSLMKIKFYYEHDFDEKNTKLEEYIIDLGLRNERKLEIDLRDVENNVKSFWKEIILKFVDRLLSKINNRTSKGGEFAKIRLDLNETKKNIPYDDLDVKTLESYYEKTMNEQYEIIKEKIQNEKDLEELNKSNKDYIDKISKESRNKGRIDGFIVSFIVGIILLIVGIILHYLGYT